MRNRVAIKLEADCYKSATLFISENSIHRNVYDQLLTMPKFNREIAHIYYIRNGYIYAEVAYTDSKNRLIALYKGMPDCVEKSLDDPRAVRIGAYTLR